MIANSETSCITFSVDDVVANTAALPTCKAHEAVKQLLQGDVESCCDYHGNVIAGIRYHPLLAAVHEAFAQHRPLVLGPDEVWITIAQGVAHHMAIHGERLRQRFVNHQGRLKLTVDVDGFVKGSPENPWADAFAGWGGQISDHVGREIYDLLMGSFSTTTVVERGANHIVLMDVFQRYFHYEALCICGIPTVTLEGTTDDWIRLRNKIDGLEAFDLAWWTVHLGPIVDQFVRAARGDIDVAHWRGICKLRHEYGGDIINGWIAKLFPYLQEYIDGPLTRKNPIFESGEGFGTLLAPSGLSKVPFVWRIALPGLPEKQFEMEAVGGFIGVTQDQRTGALRAKAGWAVKEVSDADALLNRLDRQHITVSRSEAESAAGPSSRIGRQQDEASLWAEEMEAFYFRFESAKLFDRQPVASFTILARKNVEELYGVDRKWLKFCILSDGSFLAIDSRKIYAIRQDARKKLAVLERELGPRRDAEEKRIEAEVAGEDKLAAQYLRQAMRNESVILNEVRSKMEPVRQAGEFDAYPVVHCKRNASAITVDCIVAAESFNGFLALAMESEGQYWWFSNQCQQYGLKYYQWR